MASMGAGGKWLKREGERLRRREEGKGKGEEKGEGGRCNLEDWTLKERGGGRGKGKGGRVEIQSEIRDIKGGEKRGKGEEGSGR